MGKAVRQGDKFYCCQREMKELGVFITTNPLEITMRLYYCLCGEKAGSGAKGELLETKCDETRIVITKVGK